MLDPKSPVIKKDKNLKWINSGKNRRRVHRGLTSSAKKSRGLKA
jgi:ribosomal protein L15E